MPNIHNDSYKNAHVEKQTYAHRKTYRTNHDGSPYRFVLAWEEMARYLGKNYTDQ